MCFIVRYDLKVVQIEVHSAEPSLTFCRTHWYCVNQSHYLFQLTWNHFPCTFFAFGSDIFDVGKLTGRILGPMNVRYY